MIKKESEKALFFIVEKEYIFQNIVHIINKEETHFIYFRKSINKTCGKWNI